jgi:GNAT superfamily N-acetyltransferase
MHIEPYDGPTAPEALLRDVARVWGIELADLHPEDPPYTWEEIEATLRTPSERLVKERWLARDGDGEPIGRLDLVLPSAGANESLAIVELYVVPDARKAGVGTALARTAVARLEELGRDRVRVPIVEGSPGDAFFRRLGGSVGRATRKSRMALAGLDRSMLRSWIERAEQGAHGYSLRWLDVGTLDDADMAAYIAIRSMMNTAPLGDLDDEPWVHTPDTIREEAAEQAAEGIERWSLVAVEDATGAFVGFTELMFAASAPEHGWQGGTAVRIEHRNHGIGRWLKAAMAERVLDERPHVRFVDTENAYSNEPMLHINVAMGFELVKTINDWHAPVATVRRALEEKP